MASDMLAACGEQQAEIVDTLRRALDSEFELTCPEAVPSLNANKPPEEWDGPGLVTIFKFGSVAAVAVLAEQSGLLPDWYSQPDATGHSKLLTLAQELGLLLMPAEMHSDDYWAGRVEQIGESLSQGGLASDSGWLPLQLKVGDKTGTLHVVWPLDRPDELIGNAGHAANGPIAEPVKRAVQPQDTADPFRGLPAISRSLLKVPVPVRATLATKKMSINDIVGLTAGSIIKFDKPCDELLELEVNNRHLASGEAVKVGDKFGIRIRTIVLPEERFLPAQTVQAKQGR